MPAYQCFCCRFANQLFIFRYRSVVRKQTLRGHEHVVESVSWGKKPRDAAAIMAAAAAGEDITDASSGDAVVRHSMVLFDVPVELMFHNVTCVIYSIQFILLIFFSLLITYI
jgi:hypothetical protein